MIKLILEFAAAVSLGVAVLLPIVESRLLDTPWNDEFHPEEEETVDAQAWNKDFHMDPAPPLQLVCTYLACEDLDPDERHLDMDWNDEFHPILSESFCPTEIDLGQEGILCLVPTPEPN